ncbi:MAG: hypothetical protein LBI27_10325 [Clostridiales bacterium]|jgi:hypothetical protein|nr:hypothetical protein [Clostridiales bacterium]
MNTERIKELTMSKVRNSTTRKNYGAKRYVITVIAAVLILTATVFAAGNYLTGFDRLREIVGEDAALYPVEIGTVIGEHIDDNIRIEVVAVGIVSNVADIYITIEDLTENRFNGNDVLASISVASRDGNRGSRLSTPATVIHRTPEGIITLHSRQYTNYSISGHELIFTLSNIRYNVIFEEGFGYISYDEIEIGWSFDFLFEFDENLQQTLSDDELNLYLDCCHVTLTEVILTPYTIFLELEGEEFAGVSPRVTINTTDGPLAVTGQNNTSSLFTFDSDDERITGLRILHILPVDFLDINTVISVDIAGKIVIFNS